MRLKKPIVAASTAALLALAACGGSGGGGNGTGGATDTFQEGGGAGQGKDPSKVNGPTELSGATKGGTVKVLSQFGLNTMDPTEAYYVNTGSILSNLITRSLTQYTYDEKTGQMILIPDLSTDLGTPNKNFTQWTFNIRTGVKFENGQEITPRDIAFGIMRSFDRDTFPEGATYSNEYFLDGDKYKGPYKSGTNYKGVVIKGQKLTIKMSKPFPDMPYWGAFPAMGPIPAGKASDPAKYRLHPWATGPYMFKDYTPEKSLTLVRNPNWDPATDPARTQYPDSYDFNFDTLSDKIDQILLQDKGDGQTTLSYDSVLVANYLKFKSDASDRLVTGGIPCTRMWYLDYRKITDINVRKALAYAFPYEDYYAAAGFISGVTRVPGTNVMPPGIPGREEYNPLPDHKPGTTDPAKAKQMLKDAGKLGYEISFLYATDDPYNVAAKDTWVKALKEAGFTPKPYATTTADLSTLRSDPDTKINVRDGGWCSDWPSGGSWIPPTFKTYIKEGGKPVIAANYALFSEKDVDQRIAKVQVAPLKDQPGMWNDLDKYIQETYFPVVVTAYYGNAMAHGSKILGDNNDSQASGMPTWKNISVKQ